MKALKLGNTSVRALRNSCCSTQTTEASLLRGISSSANTKNTRGVSSVRSKLPEHQFTINISSTRFRNHIPFKPISFATLLTKRSFSATTLCLANKNTKPSSPSLGRLAYNLVDLVSRAILNLFGTVFGFIFRRLGVYGAASARYRLLYLTNYDQFLVEQRKRRVFVQALVASIFLWLTWKSVKVVKDMVSRYDRSQEAYQPRLQDHQQMDQLTSSAQKDGEFMFKEEPSSAEAKDQLEQTLSKLKDLEKKIESLRQSSGRASWNKVRQNAAQELNKEDGT